ncbi:MAG: hypothetical protein K2I10_14225 [Lachnospiraceae bacterium]|nr:hypothetical protein [Lachnospiraceae bacterium]
MNIEDRKIQDMLNGNTPIPEVVEKRAAAAFDAIRTAGEEFDMEKTEITKRKWGKSRVAAAACIAVLALGTTTAAAGNYFGLLDYFNWRDREIPKEAQKLINDNVEQKGNEGNETAENQYAEFNIRQTLCDSGQMMIEIEVKALEPDKYFLMTQDWMPEDMISNLGMVSEEGDMSIEEYMEKTGKQALEVNAYVDLGEKMTSASFDTKMEPDGTLIIVENTENVIREKEMTLTCYTMVLPPDLQDKANDEGQNLTSDEKDKIAAGEMKEPVVTDNYIRDSFTFKVTDNSISEKFVYKPEQPGKIEGTAIILDEVVMTKTELGLYVDTAYHYDENATPEEIAASEEIVFDVVKENGDWLERGPGSAGGGTVCLEDGSYLQTRDYGVTELLEEMPVKVFDCMSKEQYGIIKVKKQ